MHTGTSLLGWGEGAFAGEVLLLIPAVESALGKEKVVPGVLWSLLGVSEPGCTFL